MLDALFPKTRQRVLALLLGQPERAFATRELINLAGAGSGAVQRELERLVGCGLIVASSVGSQKRYSANRAAPLFEELRGIIDKTAGLAEEIRLAVQSLAPPPVFAVLYGSVPKRSDTATSDIDVLLVGDGLTLEHVFAALQPAETRLGRRVSPTVYTREEFQKRRAAGHPFLTKVLSGPHVVLFGSEDAVAPR